MQRQKTGKTGAKKLFGGKKAFKMGRSNCFHVKGVFLCQGNLKRDERYYVGTPAGVLIFTKGVVIVQRRKRSRRCVLHLAAGLMAAVFLGGIGGSAMASASVRTVVPVGRAVGIKLFSDGVLVVGFSAIPTDGGSVAPAKECGLKEGDIITHINSEEVDTIEQVQSLLQGLEGEKMSIRCLRGEKQLQMSVRAVKCASDGEYKLGAWIRDSMAGIGTMTFYDPETGDFGALGHGINDVDTCQLMPLQSGGIMEASVTQVQKGTKGTPGQLKGSFETGDVGALRANTEGGVFGTLKSADLVKGLTAVEVARPEEIKLGPATILSNICGETVKEYRVELTKVMLAEDGDLRDMMLTVTDEELLETTGGIVQGMSGSPILQNGKIIGAVTHVLVNDPTTGYGIFLENMLKAAG